MKSLEVVLQGAQAGSAEDASALYHSYAAKVMACVRRRLGPGLRRRYDTLDLSQSVFADVLRDLPRFEFRGEREFRHWLYLKAENKVRDKLRRHLDGSGQCREQDDLERVATLTGSGPAWEEAAAIERGQQVGTMLSGLPPDERELLRLRLDEGLTFAEIARRLDLRTADAARKRYTRSLASLRGGWGSQQ